MPSTSLIKEAHRLVAFAEALLLDRSVDDMDALTTDQLVARCDAKVEAGRAAHEAALAGLTPEQLVDKIERYLRDSRRQASA
jgi:hypothetical protein